MGFAERVVNVNSMKYANNASYVAKTATKTFLKGAIGGTSRLNPLAFAIGTGLSFYIDDAVDYFFNTETDVEKTFVDKPVNEPKEIDLPILPKPIIPPVVGNSSSLSDILLSNTEFNAQMVRQHQLLNENIIHTNKVLVNAISGITKVMIANAKVNKAHQDASLENSISVAEILSVIAQSSGESESLQAYRDANYENSLETVEALKKVSENMPDMSSLNISFPDSVNVNIERSLDEIDLTSKLLENIETKIPLDEKKLEHITYETTSIQLDNITSDEIPSATPQEMRAIKNAVVAKKNSDENTFELDDEDYDDAFGMPDISSIFDFLKKSERIIQ